MIEHPSEKAEHFEPEDFDRMIADSTPGEAVGMLARIHWEHPSPILDAAARSNACNRRRQSTRTIALYYFRMGIGGIERTVCNLSKLYQSMGYRVVLITDEEPREGDYRVPGAAREVVPGYAQATADTYIERARALSAILTRYQVDVVVYNQWLCSTMAWDIMTVKSMGIPFVIHTHGSFAVTFDYGMPDICPVPLYARYADAIVCLSAVDQEFWKNFCGRTFVTVNQIDRRVDEITPSDRKGHSIVWVGRLNDTVAKQTGTIIPIMQRVTSSIPDAVLHVVGPASEGLLAQFQSQMDACGLNRNIVFEGAKNSEQMPAYYQSADAYLMTSSLEGFSLSLAEAKAAGLPCIMFELPYLSTTQGNRGIIPVEQGNTEMAADALIRVLSDKDLSNMLGSAAREHMRELESFDSAELWRTVFDAIAQQNAADFEAASSPHAEMWNLLLMTTQKSIERRNETMANVNDRLTTMQQAMAELSDSKSYKLGNVLASPLRKARGLGRKSSD